MEQMGDRELIKHVAERAAQEAVKHLSADGTMPVPNINELTKLFADLIQKAYVDVGNK